MKDSIRSSLDDVFQKLEAKKKAQEETAEAKKTRDAAFLEAFRKKQKEVIRPAMEEMLAELEQRGVSSKISAAEERYDSQKRHHGAKIKMAFPTGKSEEPYLEVQCEKEQGCVRFYESTLGLGSSGHAGSAGEATLEEVTTDLIQEKILKLVTEILR
jgi:homoserine kinase